MHEEVETEQGVEVQAQLRQGLSAPVENRLRRVLAAGDVDHRGAGIEAVRGELKKTAGAARETEHLAVAAGSEPSAEQALFLGVNVATIRVAESVLVIGCSPVVVATDDGFRRKLSDSCRLWSGRGHVW